MKQTEIVAEKKEEGMPSFQKIEVKIGKLLTDHILSQVSTGNILKAKAEQLAFALHNKVGGKFKRSQSEVNFVYDDLSLKIILSDWYEMKAHSLNQSEILKELNIALISCEMGWLVSELSEKSQERK